MPWTTYKEIYEFRDLTSEDRPIISEILENNEEAVDRVFAGWNLYNTNVLCRRKSDQKIISWAEENRVENDAGSKFWYVGARAMHPDFRDKGVTLKAVNAEALYYIFETWNGTAVYAPVLKARNERGSRYNWEATVPSATSYAEQNNDYGFVEITRDHYFGNT